MGERPVRVHAAARHIPSGAAPTAAAPPAFPGGTVVRLGCGMATARRRHAPTAGEHGTAETSHEACAEASKALSVALGRITALHFSASAR